jgi:ABC-2 type transport system permease protein
VFILLFFSSTFFPRETMEGYFRTIADVNPLSFLAEGFRTLTIESLTASAVAEVLLIPAAAAVATLALSLRTLRTRLAASR